MSEWVSEWVRQSVSQSVSQSASQLVGEWVSRSVSLSISWSVSHSVVKSVWHIRRETSRLDFFFSHFIPSLSVYVYLFRSNLDTWFVNYLSLWSLVISIRCISLIYKPLVWFFASSKESINYATYLSYSQQLLTVINRLLDEPCCWIKVSFRKIAQKLTQTWVAVL